ncbi:MAG: DUF5103 domain-containing protein, partial [Bacteroidales bacterium]|nr:DUF5103 domain-containing protein [Bacteroidales bacterium]
PLIRLNSTDQLKLTFDDMMADQKNYQYTIVHCDAYWQTSAIEPWEYIEGYETDLIEDFQISLGTAVPYTHYSLVFPNNYLQITKSGNYLLQVFTWNENDEKDLAFTQRFMVLKNTAETEGKIKKRFPEGDESGYLQAVSFSIIPKTFQIINPDENLKVVIRQNRRWDNAITDLQPTSVRPDRIEYDALQGNSFFSGNEYRNFDIKDLRNRTEQVKYIESTSEGYLVLLHPDERRTFKQYITEEDLNGLRLIRTEPDKDPQTEGDYVYVNFRLPYDYPIGIGDLYLIGELTGWQLTSEAKMTYDFEEKAYTNTLFLKQGYYEYLYAFVPNESFKGKVNLIEGNHFETGNEYSIFVYYHEPGTDYDRLISFTVISK